MGWVSISSTRVAGGLSVLALVLITISDFTWTEFWDENAMATSIVADVLVLVVGVAVVNEFISARSRSRWAIVAEYGLIELARSARRVWVGLAESIGVGSRAELTREQLRELVHDQARSGRLNELAVSAASSQEGRDRLRAVVQDLVEDSRAALTSWAGVLVESSHSDSLARFADLQALLARLDLVLDMEAQGKRPSHGELADPAWISRRVVKILETGSALAPDLYHSAESIQEREASELSAVSVRREPGSGASAGGG
jgi:hypothetical protein